MLFIDLKILKEEEIFLFNQLKEVSFRMGKNRALIQVSGGNTSIKFNKSMLIKASGQKLSNALKKNIFVEVDISNNSAFKKQNNNFKKTFSSSNLRPSIETCMHSIMPHKVVLHSHPIEVIANTLIPNKFNLQKKILKDIKWEFINYCKPGNELANAIKIALSKRHVDVLILSNHGLVVGAETPLEAELIQTKVVKTLECNVRKKQAINLDKLKYLQESIPEIYLPSDDIVHTLATDLWSNKLVKMSPYSPDHAVFCGVNPLCFNNIEQNWNLISTKSDYAIIDGLGVVLLGKKNKPLEKMLIAQAEVFLRIPINQKVKLISAIESRKLIDWEAEKYRKEKIND